MLESGKVETLVTLDPTIEKGKKIPKIPKIHTSSNQIHIH